MFTRVGSVSNKDLLDSSYIERQLKISSESLKEILFLLIEKVFSPEVVYFWNLQIGS